MRHQRPSVSDGSFSFKRVAGNPAFLAWNGCSPEGLCFGLEGIEGAYLAEKGNTPDWNVIIDSSKAAFWTCTLWCLELSLTTGAHV